METWSSDSDHACLLRLLNTDQEIVMSNGARLTEYIFKNFLYRVCVCFFYSIITTSSWRNFTDLIHPSSESFNLIRIVFKVLFCRVVIENTHYNFLFFMIRDPSCLWKGAKKLSRIWSCQNWFSFFSNFGVLSARTSDLETGDRKAVAGRQIGREREREQWAHNKSYISLTKLIAIWRHTWNIDTRDEAEIVNWFHTFGHVRPHRWIVKRCAAFVAVASCSSS